jgi:uncharacterized protein YfcZ (UPF0381/DUF406 family)
MSLDHQEVQENSDIKQQFLISEIIEQNYDPRLFTAHCEITKEANLDLWTFEELKECVRDFKEKYKSGQTLEQLSDPGTIYLQGSKKSLSELSSTPNLEVQISDPKVVDSGFFNSNFAVYTVTTLPFNWEVTREFTDFIWLRGVILNSFPGIFVPPLPGVKSRGLLQEKTLYKRKKCLIKFMQCLISHPLIIREESLRIFLKQASSQLFKEYVASVDTKKLEDLESFPCLEGTIVGDLVDHSENIEKLEEFYKKNAVIMKKLKNKAYEVVADLEEVQKHVEDLVDIVGKLQVIQDSISFTRKYEKIYAAFKEQLIAILNIQKEKVEMVNDHLCVFFKYGHLEYDCLSKFVEYNESFAILYRKALLKKMQNIENVRNFYAYFNAQNIVETNRINEFITNGNFKNFYEFSVKQAKVAKDLQESWKVFLDKLNF